MGRRGMSAGEFLHPFDAAIALAPQGNGSYLGQMSGSYANFIGPFGGTTAATLLNAAYSHPERIGEPLSLTVNFAAPIADAEFTVTAKPVRTNRTTQHWTIELVQADAVAATATVVFALRRPTWSALELRPPEAPAAAKVDLLPVAGLPAWAQNYEFRIIGGGFNPGSGERSHSMTRLWIRDRPQRPLDFLSLAAISDAFFPRLFVRRQRYSPIGTVSMTVNFHADSALLARQGSVELLGRARAQRFRDGYFDQVAELWGIGGELLATTHQMVYFKE